MSETALIVLAFGVATLLIRISGPLALGHRELPPWTVPVITVLPGALITAMIVVQVLGPGDSIEVDERLAGLAVAGSVLWWRRSAMIPAIIAAAVAVALIRVIF